MQTRYITLQHFVEKLQILTNQPIWRVIHPADGWLIIDLGRQYQDYIFDIEGGQKPYNKGEYQLTIKGHWEITQNEYLIDSKTLMADESQESYFTRMHNLVNNFPIKTISGVSFSDTIIILDTKNDYQLKVNVNNEADDIGLTIVQLSKDNKPKAYTHHRFDEKLNSFVTITSN